MKRIKIQGALLLLLIFCFFGLQGCIGGDGTKPISEMTSQQKSIMMFDMYNTEYNSYMLKTGYTKDQLGAWKKTNQPVYSGSGIEILRIKKQVLQEVYPLIKIFDNYARNGATPTPEMEAQIFGLLDRLVKLILD